MRFHFHPFVHHVAGGFPQGALRAAADAAASARPQTASGRHSAGASTLLELWKAAVLRRSMVFLVAKAMVN